MGKNTSKTSGNVASKAGEELNSPNASKANKTDAGSALSQVKPNRQTTPPVASTASQQIRKPSNTPAERSIGASVLEQTPKKKPNR